MTCHDNLTMRLLHVQSLVFAFVSLLLLLLLGNGNASTHSPSSGNRAIHVIGSVNADIFVPIEKFPEDGETILANDLGSTGMLERGKEVFLPGGKVIPFSSSSFSFFLIYCT